MRRFLRIGLLVVLALTGGRTMAQVPIPIVHTWGDLQNVPKLTAVPSPPANEDETPPVLPPVTFQIGIQSDKAASYSGLVLYFLAPNSPEGDYTPEERGLYTIEVDGPTPRPEQALYKIDAGKNTATGGITFYAETIPFAAAGDYVVKLVKPVSPDSSDIAKPAVLAQLTVHVQDRPQDLWFPWWPDEDAGGGGANSGPGAIGGRYALEPVVNPKGGAAIPKTPRPQSYAKLPEPGQNLPSLSSNSDFVLNNKIHLKMTDATLIVRLDQKIEGYFPDDHFLTRWWVNGRQVQLDPTLHRTVQARALGALEWLTQEVRFDLHFQPERLGLKRGDRVGVQLLFCPNGFTETGGLLDELQMLQALEDVPTRPPPSSFSEASNHIDFTYSGDPHHPQQ